ncbi:hypothetical protein HYDPIDRAFT_109103 [Hydnomerulius pinastri MD-312]|nr:hypothetical protein HYDPIDRAFT_109103 [Hydnomerulius pinastri MD-312]
MSTQAQHMGAHGSWSQPHYSLEQPLQLEEQFPYNLETPGSIQQFGQQRPPSQRPFNGSMPSGRYNSYGSNNFGAPSGPRFVQQEPVQPPSFNTLRTDVGPALDTSPSAFVTSPLPAHASPVYSQSSIASPDANQVNYQFGSGLNVVNRTPGGSPNPNTTMAGGSTSHSFLPTGPMQFSYPQPRPHLQSELQEQYLSMHHSGVSRGSSQNTKRPKLNEEFDDQVDPDIAQEAESSARPKAGACARCKSLKVRCEFRGDGDTCRRCTGAGQECVIPGRKPRRNPPKREHLLNQIRDQANQIQELMAKLEASNKRAATATMSATSPSDAQSPRSPASSMQSPTMESNSEDVVPNPEVQDWIAKAKKSLQAFGGLIPPGTSAGSNDDFNGYASSDGDYTAEEYSDEESGYATADDDTPKDKASPTNSIKKKEAATNTKLNLLPADDAPFGLMASLAIGRGARQKSVEPESSDAVGVANADFFVPSPGVDPARTKPATEGIRLPHILTRGVVTVQEVDRLFNIYFENMNPLTSLLDPQLHTPQFVAMRSPFLFTVVCGIASRFYTARPELYTLLMQYAQLAAGTALISGTKNEEMSAAYILMQLYPVPAKKWDEERSWVYLGVAIRIAQDINLNRPITAKPLNEHHARVLLSRQRIWMNCFNLDRSTGSQYGKRPIIPNTDYFALHSEDWWRSSPYNISGFDIHLCSYNAELRVMSDFMSKIYSNPSHPTGLNKAANFTQIASETDDALRQLGERWFKRIDELHSGNEMYAFRTELLKMAYAYSRLVALSTGLKHAKEDQLDENSFLMRCLAAATDIVNAFVRRLFPTAEKKIHLRFAPDAQFVFVTFAGAFLVKLLQPKYSPYFTYERRIGIRTLVQEAVDLLGAPEVVLDDKHGPKLFSRFLAGLLASQNESTATLSPTSAKSANSRRIGGRSKGKGKETGAALSISGYALEVPSPSNYSESPSPAQRIMHIEGSPALTRDSSPSMVDPQDSSMIPSSELFQAPMPIDQDLLDSMQFMADPAWQDTTVPGFSWMNQLNGSSGSTLNSNDYAMYEPQHYGPAHF